MSHELRTPMNAILGFAQLIDMDAGSSPRSKAHVQEILRAGKHLLHLINDVLDLEQVCHRRGLPGVPGEASVAPRLRLPALRQRWRCVPRQPHPPDVPLMPVPRHSDIWNHL
jgi:signal transduction histidine kinase